MRSKGLTAGLLVGYLFFFGTTTLGQTETGQITGVVRDERGDAVASATVTVVSSATGAIRSGTTTEAGAYSITNLQPGVYTIRIEAPGFAALATRAKVSVGRSTPLDVTIAVGGAAENLDIVAGREGLQVNTTDPTISTTITERMIRELPTIDRNPYALVQLVGNVSPLDPSRRGAGVAINGQRATSTNVLLDGGANNDEYNGTVGQNVPLDAVQEFSVLAGTYSAEFGRAGGGVVNVATKSGSNELHGTLYEFNRNSALASARFEDNAVVLAPGQAPIEKGVFNRNQFGFSLGGPIARDELLFFASSEWYRIRSTGTSVALVATPELVAASSPATRAFFESFTLETPINGRILTAGSIPVGAGAFRDLGPDLPAFGEVYYDRPADTGPGAPADAVSLVGRVDWNVTDRTTAYARYALERRSPLPTSFTPYAGLESAIVNRNHNVLGSVTHVVSPRLVTQTKFVYNRIKFAQEFGTVPLGPSLGAGFTAFGGTPLVLPRFRSGRFEGPQNLLQFYEDVNYSAGAHALRFGGSLVRILDNRSFGAQEQSTQTLGVGLTETLNNLVLGRIRSFSTAVDPRGRYPFETVQLPLGPPSFTRENRYTEFALYLTDTWRAHPRLTLTLGLRYEYFGVQHNADRSKDSNFYLGEGATIFERLRNGQVLLTEQSPVDGFYHPDANNFGPRIGVAWDVLGDGRTSLRGGYGVGYERNFGGATISALQNPPNFANVAVQAINVGLPFLPIYTDNYGPFNGNGTARLPRTSLRYLREDLRTAYAHNWSVSLQRELFTNALLSVEYAGSKGVALYTLENLTPALSGAVHLGATPDDDPNNPFVYVHPLYSAINARGNNGFSNHNSLTLAFDGDDVGGSGLRFTTRYTWGHSIDNLSSTFSESGNNFNLGLLDPFDPRLDKGDADFDVRHRFVTSGVWKLPFAQATTGAARYALDGWELACIFEARTGAPFSIFDTTNTFSGIAMRLLEVAPIDRDGMGATRPVDDPSLGNRYVYIDLSSQLPGAGSYANAAATAAASALFGEFTPVSDFGPFPSNMTARNAFRRPGYWNLDLGLYKNLALGERVLLQLRAELYNALNHANLYISDFDTDVAFLDHVPAAFQGRRQVQLAVKLIF